MNKGARIRRLKGVVDFYGVQQYATDCERVRSVGFTADRIYRVKAGRGDATVGSKGNLDGAFILNETQMVLTDDYGRNRQVSFDTRFWELVEDCENLNPVRNSVDVFHPRATA